MIMEMTRTQITFPVEIERPQAREEAIWVVSCFRSTADSRWPLLPSAACPACPAASHESSSTCTICINLNLMGAQAIVTKLVETKLMQLLRFKFGEVYTVNVSAFFGAEAASHKGGCRFQAVA